jgi:hypothetical protein
MRFKRTGRRKIAGIRDVFRYLRSQAGRECYGLEDAAILEGQKMYKKNKTEFTLAREMQLGFSL